MKTTLVAVSLAVLTACGPDSTAVISDSHSDEAAVSSAELNWLGNDPQLWRHFWYAKHESQVVAPIEAGVTQVPFVGAHTVLLIPGTTIGPEFFAPMEARLKRDGFDVVVWAPADLFTDDLATGAARIGAAVDQLLLSRHKTKLSIVAQCDAGVAARYYAQVLGGSAHLDQLVTFVSAHHGSAAAPAGSWFTGWAALKNIRFNSAFLNQLNAGSLPSGLQLTSIYSCMDEYMWPQSTSVVTGATNVLFCNHYVSHFSPFWDPLVYGRIRSALRGEGASAPNSY